MAPRKAAPKAAKPDTTEKDIQEAQEKTIQKPSRAKTAEEGEPITNAQAEAPDTDNQGDLSKADIDNGNYIDGQGDLHKVSFPDGKFEVITNSEGRVAVKVRGWIGDDPLSFHSDSVQELIDLLKRV